LRLTRAIHRLQARRTPPHGHARTDRPPQITEALQLLRATSATIDGDTVVCDSSATSDFNRLHSASLGLARHYLAEAHGSRSCTPSTFWNWMAAILAGDQGGQPRGALSRAAQAGDGIRAEHMDGDGPAMFRQRDRARRDRLDETGPTDRALSGLHQAEEPDAPAATRNLERPIWPKIPLHEPMTLGSIRKNDVQPLFVHARRARHASREKVQGISRRVRTSLTVSRAIRVSRVFRGGGSFRILCPLFGCHPLQFFTGHLFHDPNRRCGRFWRRGQTAPKAGAVSAAWP